MDRRSFKAACKQFVKIFFVMNESCPCTTQCKRWTDNQREAKFLCNLLTFKKRVGRFSRCSRNLYFFKKLFKLLPVFCYVNGIDINTDKPYIEILPYPFFLS